MRGLRNSLLWLARRWLIILLAAVSVGLATKIGYSERFTPLEFEAEQRIQMRYSPASLSDKIAVIKISAADTAIPGKPPGLSVPRAQLAQLIDGLKRYGATVVVFDLAAKDPEPNDDPILAAAVQRSPPLKLAFFMNTFTTSDERARNGLRYQFEAPPFLPDDPPETVAVGQSEGVPTGRFFGSIALLCRDENAHEEVENLALVAFRQFYNIDEKDVEPDWKNYRLTVGTNSFQMGPDGDFIIDWPSEGSDFPTMGFKDALEQLSGGDPRQLFKGKIVIVGNEIGDPKVSTVHGTEVGLLMIANSLNTMLRADQGKPHRIWFEENVVWASFLSLVICSGFAVRSRVLKSVCVASPFVLAILMPPASAYFGRGVPEVTLGVLTCIVSLPLAALACYVVPGLYPMSPKATFEATVLFLDLKDSTPLVARLGSKQGGRFLSGALALARKSILAEGGEVVRTTGDGLVAIFQAGPLPDHARSAVRAFERMNTELKKIAPDQSDEINFRAGIESGTAFGRRGDFQGLPFHIAARLEQLAATRGRDLIVGPTAAGLLDPDYVVEGLGQEELKGISGKVMIFAITRRPMA